MKNNLRKVIATVLLSSMALMLVPTISMAGNVEEFTIEQQENEISPRFTYIVDAETDLILDGTTATVDCWVAGHVNTATKAKVIAELQVKSGSNWIPVAIWTDTQNAFKASVYETKTITEGNTYRVKATYTVWEGDQSETRIFYTN